MWAGVTGGPPWGNGMMPGLSSESGALARGTLRLKTGGSGRVARVPGAKGGSREVQLTYLPSRSHLPELGPPLAVMVGRVWARVQCCSTLGEGPGGLQVASVQWCLKSPGRPFPRSVGSSPLDSSGSCHPGCASPLRASWTRTSSMQGEAKAGQGGGWVGGQAGPDLAHLPCAPPDISSWAFPSAAGTSSPTPAAVETTTSPSTSTTCTGGSSTCTASSSW